MKIWQATVLVASLGLANVAVAGEYQDKLSKCLKSAITAEDKRQLVRWVFAMYANHPDVSDLSKLTAAQSDDISRKGASVFQKLIADKCASQSREAIINEGMEGYGAAFESLGETAIGGLIEDPSVQKSMEKLYKYLDQEKLMKALMTGSSQAK